MLEQEPEPKINNFSSAQLIKNERLYAAATPTTPIFAIHYNIQYNPQ